MFTKLDSHSLCIYLELLLMKGIEKSITLHTFCEKHEIIHETTPPHSPESNRVVERKNRTLKDMMKAMLVSLGAPLNL